MKKSLILITALILLTPIVLAENISTCGHYTAGLDYYLTDNIVLENNSAFTNVSCITFINSEQGNITNLYGNEYSLIDNWSDGTKGFNFFINVSGNGGIFNFYNGIYNQTATNPNTTGNTANINAETGYNMSINVYNYKMQSINSSATVMGGVFPTGAGGTLWSNANKGNYTIINLSSNVNVNGISASGNFYIENANNINSPLYVGDTTNSGFQATMILKNITRTPSSATNIIQRSNTAGRTSNFTNITLNNNYFLAQNMTRLFNTATTALQVDYYNLDDNYWEAYSPTCLDLNSDSICDTPYTTTDNYTDNYPKAGTTGYGLPEITSFTTTNDTIQDGDSTLLEWVTSSDTDLDLSGTNVTGLANLSVSPTLNTTYVLTATKNGVTINDTLSITVYPAPSSPTGYVALYEKTDAPVALLDFIIGIFVGLAGLSVLIGIAYGLTLASKKLEILRFNKK